MSFCAHALLGDGLFEVEDATLDPRFADNPLVRGDPGIRFYAGMPLVMPGGEVVGTLCVIDSQPRRLGATAREALAVLARSVTDELELRQRVGELEEEVARRHEAEARIMQLATRDALTGLPNRAALMDRLHQGVRAAQRSGNLLAVLFLDLDRFKWINDTLGHDLGDALLQEMALRLSRAVRECDTVARLGGDEFAIVLGDLWQVADAEAVAAKIVDVITRPLEVRGHALRVGGSVGVAVYPFQAHDEESLLRHADQAMYHAKESGGNRHQLFSEQMNARAVERIQQDMRDAFFVVRALNSLSEVGTMEDYLRWLTNVVVRSRGGHIQPLYGIGQEEQLPEAILDHLPGYRGMGPVRVGNQAFEHHQHDVYGNIVLGAAQAFHDRRLLRRAGPGDFRLLERVGERAFELHDQPDAGRWELRTRARVHTSSSLMCWAACDRLARIAGHLGLDDRARLWQSRAAQVRAAIDAHAWNPTIGSYAESFGGSDVDAGLLLMLEVGYLGADDPRIVGTIAEVERRLRRGDHLLRYSAPDDFGTPTTAFNICTFWYIDALSRTGRRAEARELFGRMLACRNSLGLLSEDFETDSRELWGNYPQTYSLVGIINAAVRLSRSWDEVV